MHRPYKSITKSWLYSFASSWVNLAQGVVGVISLGLITPNWDIDFVFWDAKRQMEKKIAETKIPRNIQKDKT